MDLALLPVNPWKLNTLDTQLSNRDAILTDEADDQLGRVIDQLGDFNGDGLDDLVMNSPNYTGAERVFYVLFGRDQAEEPFPASFKIQDLAPEEGVVFKAPSEDGFSLNLVGLGDVNGDQLNDLLITSTISSFKGSRTALGGAYIIYGDRNLNGVFALDSLTSESGVVVGSSASSLAGASSVGDFNQDGIPDFRIGSGNTMNLIYGKDQNYGDTLDIATMDDSELFKISLPARGFDLRGAEDAGDINADGKPDLIIASRRNTIYDVKGTVSVLFGRDDWATNEFNLDSLNPSLGFRISGVQQNDEFGESISKAGDVNHDGIDDFLIGARYHNRASSQRAGAAYVVFGAGALAPMTGNPIPDQSVLVDSLLNFTLPEQTFTDANFGDSFNFQYEVSLVNGQALPGWLLFSEFDQTFSGTPSQSDLGDYEIQVKVIDEDGLSVTDTFKLSVLDNFAPVIDPIASLFVELPDSLSYVVTAFDQSVPAQQLTFSVDEEASNQGVKIDSLTGELTWAPTDPEVVLVTITVSDGNLQTSQDVQLQSLSPNSVEDPLFGQLSIHPNPVKSKLRIQNMASAQEVSILTLTGETLRTLSLTGDHAIDVSELSAGVYFISFKSEEGYKKTLRFVKQ